MKTYLLSVWDSARASYWFLPAQLALAAVVLSVALPQLDYFLADKVEFPSWLRTTTDAARATLTATGGAMVAVTGTVFSITIVTLSLASQQFGPRLLRRFMYDLTTQFTLGVFLSTGFYCLLVLRIIEAGEGNHVPHLAVMAAMVLAVISMGMLIIFIHRTAMLIQAPNVVAGVAADLDDAVQRLFPERLGTALKKEESQQLATEMPELTEEQAAHKFRVKSSQEGYVQAIDSEGLLAAATDAGIVLQLDFTPGHFITLDAVLATGWPSEVAADDKLEVERIEELFNRSVVVGTRRTPRQDVECAIIELVEVAVRALSPGINDPFTAINCIDRLSATLGRLAERELPSPYRCDKAGKLRVIVQGVDFATALDAAYNQIRQYGRDSVAVTIRLLDGCCSIATHVTRPTDIIALRQHAEMIQRSGQVALPEEADKADVSKRFEKFLTILETRTLGVPLG